MNPSNHTCFNLQRLQNPTASLMHAFSLPPNNIGNRHAVSQWNGKPICQPRLARAFQTVHYSVVRRELVVLSQETEDTNQESAFRDIARSGTERDERLLETQVQYTAPAPTSTWLVVVESAVQVTILALAIAGSLHSRRRVLFYLLAILSVPQFALIQNRLWRHILSPAPPRHVVGGSKVPHDEGERPITESVSSGESAHQVEDRNAELSLARSKIISASIRTAVAEEVDSLRYAIEQMEQTAEQRQQTRNLAIAEAIASLDEGLRSLRRTVDTRNQVEQSAPFALVSELEIVKLRLKQVEQEKVELEVRLRAAEDNFEEAKRQGERARRDADEAASSELRLRTDLAVSSSRLFRLEEVTDRLDRAERRNDELEDQIINRTREQEGFRQSAEDAERRVVRIENVAKMLREKIQELAGRAAPRYQEGRDLRDRVAEEKDGQFWPQRLRGRGDLRPDSVIYQEVLQDEKELRSPKWPIDPLRMKEDSQDEAQLKKLPDDGGFGVGDAFTDQSSVDPESDSKLLSPEKSRDTFFSFSRGEFDGSQTGNEEQSDGDGQTVTQSSGVPADSSRSSNALSTQDDVDPLDEGGKEGQVAQTGDQAQVPSTASSVAKKEAKENQIDETKVSKSEVEASRILQNNSEDTTSITSPLHVQIPEPVQDDTILQTYSGEDKNESGEDSVVGSSNIPFSSLSNIGDTHSPQKQDEVSGRSEGETVEGELGIASESVDTDSVQQDPPFVHDAKAPHEMGNMPQPAVPIEPTSDSDQQQPTSSISPDAQVSKRPFADAAFGEGKVVTSEQTTSYLESLSRSEPSRPTETIEDQLKSARELVKKARTRGLAVAQADRLFERASEKLESVLDETDDRTEVEADLGGCLLAWAKTNIADPVSQGRLSTALSLLSSSLQSQPDNETVLFNTGLCFCLVASTSTKEKAMEDYRKASEMYERLVRLNGNSRIACFNCGLAYVSLGRLSLENEEDKNSTGYFERAAALFQRSLELKPGDSKAISYLDDCRRQLRELDSLQRS